ncbi:hypothetical protein CTA2_866 [Colletotrichum tanaceti]|nr:hypothetical protein CTA2_866 [Colletotrichum tanaceti]
MPIITTYVQLGSAHVHDPTPHPSSPDHHHNQETFTTQTSPSDHVWFHISAQPSPEQDQRNQQPSWSSGSTRFRSTSTGSPRGSSLASTTRHPRPYPTAQGVPSIPDWEPSNSALAKLPCKSRKPKTRNRPPRPSSSLLSEPSHQLPSDGRPCPTSGTISRPGQRCGGEV